MVCCIVPGKLNCYTNKGYNAHRKICTHKSIVLALTRNQVRGHRIGSSHSGAEEYPREKTRTNQRWYTHRSQLTQFMPPPKTYKSEIGNQPTMCQVHILVHTSHYSRLEKPTIPIAIRDYHITLHVVPITTHTHDRRKPIGK